MKDSEIIDLAVETIFIAQAIINEAIYSKINGKISIRWVDIDDIYAIAATKSQAEESADHIIRISYLTAIQLYRDVEQYFEYINSGVDNKFFDELFKGFEYPKTLCHSSDYEARCKNMFNTAFTWIIYHELGHLVQEHGFIKSKYGVGPSSDVIDCASTDLTNDETIKGKQAAISHITEMAADFFGTQWCIEIILISFEGKELESEVRHLMCALSLVMYRFYGNRSYEFCGEPRGTHPLPIIRLEQVIPPLFEFLSHSNHLKDRNSDLNREDLVHLASWAANTSAIFWLKKLGIKDIREEYFLQGSRQRPNMNEYHRIMIKTWDEIKPDIDNYKRLKIDAYDLRFSDEYRATLFSENSQ